MSEKCLLFLRVPATVKLKTRAKYRGIFLRNLLTVKLRQSSWTKHNPKSAALQQRAFERGFNAINHLKTAH